MHSDINHTIKQILADPVGCFSKQNPGLPERELSGLASLWQEFCLLKNTLQDVDIQTKALSGKIGEFKKAGKDANDLILHMQAHSKEKAGISQHLQKLETDILSYFEFTHEPGCSQKPAAKKLRTHTYPDKTFNQQQISINVFGDDVENWNAYVKTNPSATIYHMAEWRQLIKNTFGHDGHYLYASGTNNKIKGVLPLIRLKSRLFGDFLVSMPYFNYGGAVADHPDIESKLMSAANDYASELNASHIEYRDDVARTDYPARTDKVNMILPLPSCKQVLWEGFTPKLRAQIKRPQRENPVVKHGHVELLEDFYRVFARNMRDLGTPVYGRSFFHHILMTFPEQSRILTISLGNKPVAAAFLIGYGETLEIPWASTVRAVNHLSINMLMYWEILGFAIENNYSFFDFGRSSKKAGTYQFKKQWGARPIQSYWHYWLSTGKTMPSLNPNNPKYRLAIEVWKRLPISVTKLVGPMIVKNLP